jgi:hypothetical protein
MKMARCFFINSVRHSAVVLLVTATFISPGSFKSIGSTATSSGIAMKVLEAEPQGTVTFPYEIHGPTFGRKIKSVS